MCASVIVVVLAVYVTGCRGSRLFVYFIDFENVCAVFGFVPGDDKCKIEAAKCCVNGLVVGCLKCFLTANCVSNKWWSLVWISFVCLEKLVL